MTPCFLWLLTAHAILLVAALSRGLTWGTHEEVGASLVTACCFSVFIAVAGLNYVREGVRGQLTHTQVAIGGIALALAATFIPPFLSAEVFDNLARGRVEAHYDANPYLMPSAQYPEDPFARAAERTSFGNPKGPLFTALQSALSWVVGGHVRLGAYASKLLAALCHLLAAWFIYRAVSIARPALADRAMFLYLWNPWILLETAVHARSDSLVALCVASVAWAVTTRRMALAALALGAAAMIEHRLAFLGPLLLVMAWRRGELRGLVVGAAASTAVAAALAMHYFTHPAALDALVTPPASQHADLQSFATLLLGSDQRQAVFTIGLGLAVLFAIWAATRTRDTATFCKHSAHTLVIAILLATASSSPSCHLWWLPLAVVATRSHRMLASIAFLGPASYLWIASTGHPSAEAQLWQWAIGILTVAMVAFSRPRAGTSSAHKPTG